jgi:hypothetical protein
MGFLSKIFKPVSKVLDKIIPNEIKPALPYAAAFAPMLAPGIMGAFGNSMLSRGLIGGGLNLGAQLAQEGSEGDFNPLSVALAGGIGALSAPQSETSSFFENTVRPESANEMTQYGMRGSDLAPSTILDKGRNIVADAGIKSSDFLSKALSDKFSKEGLYTMAGMGGQGLMDNAYADAMRAEKDFENSEGGGSGYGEGNQNRGLAVRRAMERGGHEEQTIRDMLESLGYEDPDPQDLAYGGRVNAMNGGIMSNQRMNFAGGGMDYMPTEPSMMGNPAVIEVIEAGDDMRENRIMNPDVEDIADYSIDLKENNSKIDLMGLREETKEPDFGGITEAVEKRPADSMLMQIAKEVGPMLLGLPGMAYLAGKSAYKMYQNLKKEDQDKVMDISEKIITQNKKDGGMMSVLPQGMEMDYRGGGFIPMGSKERADDVPARVSKNEFVMTADAVKAAGGGSVNEGARRMYNLMNNLEARA